jgi:hypothetical protein
MPDLLQFPRSGKAALQKIKHQENSTYDLIFVQIAYRLVFHTWRH